jgi:peptidoglycan/LPS O-acetylase OafA/YrhL
VAKVALSDRAIALLDCARAVAAIYVVVHHVAAARGWAAGLTGIPFRFGQEAVILFFLISGFVIFANEKDRATTGFGYYYRRFRRIYPPLLVALLISTAVFWTNGTLAQNFSLRDLGLTLLNLQDISSLKPGVLVDPYLGNDPLWSLSYEMAFYLVFPSVLTAWKRGRTAVTAAVGIVCTLAYVSFLYSPNHFSLIASYFLVWWSGAMAAEAYMEGARSFVGMPLALASLALLTGASALGVVIEGFFGPGVHPFLEFRHFSVALLVILVGFSPIGRLVASFASRLSKPARAVSAISYGIYVLHYPLLIQSNLTDSILGLLAMAILLVPLAYFADPYLNRVLPRWESVKLRLSPSAA